MKGWVCVCRVGSRGCVWGGCVCERVIVGCVSGLGSRGCVCVIVCVCVKAWVCPSVMLPHDLMHSFDRISLHLDRGLSFCVLIQILTEFL